MKVKYENSYYIVESGKVLEIAEAFRNEHTRVHNEIIEYLKSLGASQYNTNLNGQIHGCVFDDKIPEGFTKEKKYGICLPKKKSTHYDKFKSFIFPNPYKYMEFYKIPTGISYKYENGSGGTALGNPFKPVEFYWYDVEGPILLKIPNIKYYVKKLKQQYKNIKIADDKDGWEMPLEGLHKVLIEEWDLMAAKHKQMSEENE